MKLEIKNRKITEKSPNMCRLNITLLVNTSVKEKLKRNVKIFELHENENATYQNVGYRENSA